MGNSIAVAVDFDSGLLISAIISLSAAVVYLFQQFMSMNAGYKKDLDECLQRERDHWEKPDDK